MTHTRQAALCNRAAFMPSSYILRALAFDDVPGTLGQRDVVRYPLCLLEEHSDGPHHAIVLQLDGETAGSVWARWVSVEAPVLVRLPDCNAPGCCAFDGHDGGHTPELRDPTREADGHP
jgi:hypothetical protein